MRGFRMAIATLLAGSIFFVSSFFTMCISELIVNPFGLHGYTYGQAMAIDFVSILGLAVIGVIYVLISVLTN